MLELPDVTLFSIHTAAHELHLKALDDCLRHVKFGDVKLFTDKIIGPEAPFVTLIPQSTDLALFHNYEFPKHVKTSHVLAFQWDAWVLNPSAWTNEFLKYDYIGAPWWYFDGFNVGNSGFALRSRALYEYLSEHRDEFPIKPPEDDTLCRHYRKRLPQFKWAPDALAFRFAFERIRRNFPPFGYHGLFNWPLILTNKQIEERLVGAPQYVFNKVEYGEMRQLMAARQ